MLRVLNDHAHANQYSDSYSSSGRPRPGVLPVVEESMEEDQNSPSDDIEMNAALYAEEELAEQDVEMGEVDVDQPSEREEEFFLDETFGPGNRKTPAEANDVLSEIGLWVEPVNGLVVCVACRRLVPLETVFSHLWQVKAAYKHPRKRRIPKPALETLLNQAKARHHPDGFSSPIAPIPHVNVVPAYQCPLEDCGVLHISASTMYNHLDTHKATFGKLKMIKLEFSYPLSFEHPPGVVVVDIAASIVGIDTDEDVEALIGKTAGLGIGETSKEYVRLDNKHQYDAVALRCGWDSLLPERGNLMQIRELGQSLVNESDESLVKLEAVSDSYYQVVYSAVLSLPPSVRQLLRSTKKS